jgi:hypothetical protein
MFARTPSIAALAALLAISLPGCGGDETPAPTEKPVKADGKTKTPVAAQAEEWPAAPLEMAVNAPNADRAWGFNMKTEYVGGKHTLPNKGARVGETLPVGVKLETPDGDKKLGGLLKSNSLVFYFDTDIGNKQNKAATRLLRKATKYGRGMGMRTVVVFKQGTSMKDALEWFKKRHMEDQPIAAIDTTGSFAEKSGWDLRSVALVDESGVVGAYFGPSTEWDARVGTDGGATSDLLYLAWDMPVAPPSFTQADKQAAVDIVRATLRNGGTAPDSVKGLLSQGDLGKKVEHGLWLTLYRPGDTTIVRRTIAEGTVGGGLVELVNRALTDGKTDAAFVADAAKLKFAIDVEGPSIVVPTRYDRSLWYLFEPGVDGARVTSGGKTGAMLPHEPVTKGLLTPRVRGRTPKIERMLGEACANAGLAKDAWKNDSVELTRFRTTNWGVVVPDGPSTDFFRGNVLWDGLPGEAAILESLKIGGQWLAYTVKEDGKFDYEYFPNQDKSSSGYNIVRHAGSVYGLFEMWHLAEEESVIKPDQDIYLDKASRAIGFIYDALKTPKNAKEKDRVCLIERNSCESGSNALALLTFLGRPEKDQIPAKYRTEIYRQNDEAIMEGLALTMVDMIDKNGKVFRRYSEAISQPKVKKEPLYYPGEVMLALMSYYKATEDKRWLEAAEKIAERQIKWYKRDRFIVPDHWVMQAFRDLWRVTKKDKYAESAYAMATHYSSEQYPYIFQGFPDYYGAWRRTDDTPRTTRAGSRSEALRGVMHLAWERGDDATVYEDSLLMAARHLMEQQYTERNSYWVPDFTRVRGAYPMGVVDNHIRIDNNQHALVGITGALEVARKRGLK